MLDNVDPEHVRRTLDGLSLADTAINVVSRSGTTAETLANFLVVREAYEDRGVDWTERIVVTTGESGPLRALADQHDLPTLPVPEGVPGRFSALSAVGLVPPAILGIDIEGLLAGGQQAADDLAPSLYDSPPTPTARWLARKKRARRSTPSALRERLESFGEWFAQLWAESLGKDGRGQTPARALGATDQHSQLQLYRAGHRDKVVTFVRPRERADVSIPDPDHEDLSYLAGTDLGGLIDAEYEATVASLPAADRPALEVEIDRLDAESVGELLYAMEAACVLVGELADVETFTQPAVEWGKHATRALIRGEATDETAVIDDRERLRFGETSPFRPAQRTADNGRYRRELGCSRRWPRSRRTRRHRYRHRWLETPAATSPGHRPTVAAAVRRRRARRRAVRHGALDRRQAGLGAAGASIVTTLATLVAFFGPEFRAGVAATVGIAVYLTVLAGGRRLRWAGRWRPASRTTGCTRSPERSRSQRESGWPASTWARCLPSSSFSGSRPLGLSAPQRWKAGLSPAPRMSRSLSASASDSSVSGRPSPAG